MNNKYLEIYQVQRKSVIHIKEFHVIIIPQDVPTNKITKLLK